MPESLWRANSTMRLVYSDAWMLITANAGWSRRHASMNVVVIQSDQVNSLGRCERLPQYWVFGELSVPQRLVDSG